LEALNDLISRDIVDATGESSDAALEERQRQIDAEAKSREWLTDPGKTIEDKLKALRDALLAGQLGALKALWPILLVGGGIAALVFFGPALGVAAKKLAGRGNGG